MPGPKSGDVGSPVTPADPKVAADADDSKGGTSKTYSRDAGESKNTHKADPEKKSWIEVEMVYESNGKPVPGVAYEVTLPDGTLASGVTDENGVGRVDGFEPGSCNLTFPDLDKEAWEDA